MTETEKVVHLWLSKKLREALKEEYGWDWEKKLLLGEAWLDTKTFSLMGTFKDTEELSFFLLKSR